MIFGSTVVDLLALILAVDLAQFGLVVDHRGRLAGLEERVRSLADGSDLRTDGGPTAATEAESERDGLLSWAGEWHATTLGAGFGAVGAVLGRPEVAAIGIAGALGLEAARRLPGTVASEIQQEPWYAVGGVVAGYLAGGVV